MYLFCGGKIYFGGNVMKYSKSLLTSFLAIVLSAPFICIKGASEPALDISDPDGVARLAILAADKVPNGSVEQTALLTLATWFTKRVTVSPVALRRCFEPCRPQVLEEGLNGAVQGVQVVNIISLKVYFAKLQRGTAGERYCALKAFTGYLNGIISKK